MSIKVEKSEIRDPKMLDIISSDLRVIITKKFSSIPSSFAVSFNVFKNSSASISGLPFAFLIALTDAFKKLLQLTPGISTGY